jgi:hypothetical protein
MRRLVWVFLLILLGSLGLWLARQGQQSDPRDALYPLVGPPYPIDPAAFDRIRLGMSREEVKAAIGEPGGEYDGPSPPRWGTLEIGSRPVVREGGMHYDHNWEGQEQKYILHVRHGKEFWLEVVFGDDDRVIGYYLEKPRQNWWR